MAGSVNLYRFIHFLDPPGETRLHFCFQQK